MTVFLVFFCKVIGEMPEDNEWVQVIGVLEMATPLPNMFFPAIVIQEITVLEERGEEFVTR